MMRDPWARAEGELEAPAIVACTVAGAHTIGEITVEVAIVLGRYAT